MKLVIYPGVEAERLEKIRKAAGSATIVNASDERHAQEAIADADAFLGKLTPSMLSAATRLRWVQSPTASLEHYIFPQLVDHPCVLTNMRGLYSDVIADQVLGYILCFARNLHRYIRQQAVGRWEAIGGESGRSTFAAGPGTTTAVDRAHMQLSDMTLGIVGLGSIGRDIASRAMAFGLSVLAVDPVQTAGPAGIKALWKPDRLNDLLGASDFVAVAAPHTPDTAKMFRLDQFRQMKRTGYFINIGRGAIVDLADLTAALEGGLIAGAALDVFEIEPLPPGHALWKMENVIITPHIAGYSPRIAERHLALLLDNIERFTRGEPLRNIVDKRKWF